MHPKNGSQASPVWQKQFWGLQCHLVDTFHQASTTPKSLLWHCFFIVLYNSLNSIAFNVYTQHKYFLLGVILPETKAECSSSRTDKQRQIYELLHCQKSGLYYQILPRFQLAFFLRIQSISPPVKWFGRVTSLKRQKPADAPVWMLLFSHFHFKLFDMSFRFFEELLSGKDGICFH